VWIGQNATILPGVHIGDGAIVGANSVVGSDVGPYTIVVGKPAKPVRKRFETLIPLLSGGDLALLRRTLKAGREAS
jgi:virginiamycin A acetyltransferase